MDYLLVFHIRNSSDDHNSPHSSSEWFVSGPLTKEVMARVKKEATEDYDFRENLIYLNSVTKL